MTLISKENLLAKLEQQPPDQFYNVASIRNFIKAEAEAVVRCKDCKYFYGSVCVKHDGFMKERMQSDDFCSRAERKEE